MLVRSSFFTSENAERKVEFEQKYVQISSATIYYQVSGAGKPLVLVHGLAGSTRWWRRNVAFLSRHYCVYLIDLIGFGRGRRQRFVLSEAAGLLAAWMDELGIPRASLVGHSMGGFIVADLAARFPDRVERLVLVDAAAIPFGRSLRQKPQGLLQALRYMPLNFLPVLVADSLRAGPITILKALREILTADITADLVQIKAPTLIVWGEKDSLVPLEIGEALHQYLPDSRLVIIEGAGHNPMWDRPEVFNQALGQFLES